MRRLTLGVALLACSVIAHAYDWPLTIPSDAQAQHYILEIGGTWPGRTAITRRTSASGTHYAKRFYDCLNHTVKFLGAGATLDAMAQSKPDEDMAPVAPGSVADYVEREACKR